MCKYSLHHLACKHVKVKVDERCYFQTSDQTFRQYCILTPPPNFDVLHSEIRLLPHPKDGVTTFVRETYGPGVCENMHCRRAFGLLPQDESEDGSDEPYVVDDTPYDMSELACSTREMAWWSSLSDDDSQEALRFAIANGMIFDTNSDHGFPAMQDYMSELILFDLNDWRTLNPRFMTAQQLYHRKCEEAAPRTPSPVVQSQLNEGTATSMGNSQDVLMSEEPTSTPRKRKRGVNDIRANLSDSDSCDMDMTD
ncbi:hypothetical protein LTR66_009055 [Elasticomyces elasticus]|nr:hypothetical protein LTR66_009055 [Elasticomyces elasticus]